MNSSNVDTDERQNITVEKSKDTKKIKEKKPKGTFVLVNFYKVLKLVWAHDKKFIPIEIILLVLSSVLPIVLSGFSALFINKITSGNLTTLFDPALIGIVAVYLSLPLFIELADIWYEYMDAKFNIFFSQFINLMFIEKKNEIDIQSFENLDFNNLMLRVNENISRTLHFCDWGLYLLGKLISLFSVVFVLLYFKWWYAPLLVLAVLPNLLVQTKFGERAYGIFDAKAEIKRKYNMLTWYFSDVPTLTEIKIFKTKNYFKNIIGSLLNTFNTEINNNEARRTKYTNSMVLIQVIAAAFIVFNLMNGVIDKTLEIGTFIFLLGRMTDVRDSLSSVFRGFGILVSNNNFINDFFKFIDTKKVVQNGDKELCAKTPEIEFSNVSFAYPDTKKNVLNNFNFKIKAGEKIAIVGVNGAGKTTLTKLIMRFYDVTKGSILIDGENIKNLDISGYYQKIGLLSQNYAKYKLPVMEAIALGDTSVPLDLDRVIEASKKSGAHEFVSSWEHGYESHLGKEFDNGVEPSVGQWQKLALARMFYRNPQIWILDEPTASIDSIAEMEIFQELENLPEDKTVILISHRFNTVKNANRIMVIEDGEVKEFDSHHKLMRIKDGIYKKLFEMQKKSYETVA
jgi:ATP-binding cassette subfamily B protein